MALKTSARPAKKPAVRKAVCAPKNTKIAKPGKNSKAASIVTQGRHVPSKILSENSGAPVGALLARVSRAIEDELTQIEMIVSGGAKLRERNQAERRARTLASLARTLREVMQLRAGEEKTKRDDDAVPRDIFELRRELARRLERIVAGAKTAHPDASE